MRNEHTPGPWKVSSYNHHYGTYKIEPWAQIERNWLIKKDITDHHGEREANARLIAAAPELLEVCEEVLNNMEVSLEMFTKLKHALSRAKEGER